MDALLTPNRSLSRAAFKLVMLVYLLVSLAMSAVFWSQGAYFVVGFLGLEIALLYAALSLNYRAGRIAERVRVAFDRVLVSRTGAGRDSHWVTSPLWLRVEEAADAVRLAAGGRELAIGTFLSATERDAFAAALRAALLQAKRSPPPNLD